MRIALGLPSRIIGASGELMLLEHATQYIQANYGYNPELAAKRLRTLPTSEKAVEEAIKRQHDMGVDEFILRPCAENFDQMDRLAEIAARTS